LVPDRWAVDDGSLEHLAPLGKGRGHGVRLVGEEKKETSPAGDQSAAEGIFFGKRGLVALPVPMGEKGSRRHAKRRARDLLPKARDSFKTIFFTIRRNRGQRIDRRVGPTPVELAPKGTAAEFFAKRNSSCRATKKGERGLAGRRRAGRDCEKTFDISLTTKISESLCACILAFRKPRSNDPTNSTNSADLPRKRGRSVFPSDRREWGIP